MITKPALQKILKGIVEKEEIHRSLRTWERINLIRRTDKQMRGRKESSNITQ
jgi:hypothetical protein